MTIYETICDVNEKLIKKESIETNFKQDTINYILNNISGNEKINSFIKHFKDNKNMYPLYFIPPYNNGKKLRIISGYKPKTILLSSNHYELEILRILNLWSNKNDIVKDMTMNTLTRLDKTCFGHYCSKGECIGASVTALRFINTVCHDKTDWVKELLNPLSKLFIDQKGMGIKNNFPFFYFCLVLSELPIELAKKYIIEKQEFLKKLLTRGSLIGPNENDTYNILILYIIRNTLCRINEFKHIENELIYIKENRCYCKV